MARYEIYGVEYEGELIYIGKTQYGLPKRRSKHKYEAFVRLFKDDFHEFIRNVEWDKLQWFVIDNDICSQEELTQKEKYYIKKLYPKLNKQGRVFTCHLVDGTYVGTFSNIYDTGRELGINPRYISKNLHGDLKKTKGYVFTYKEVM